MRNWVLSCAFQSFVLVLGAGLAPASAKDILEADPANSKVLVENEQVRLIDYTAKAGDKAPMHTHPATVTYVLSGGTVRFSYPDGKTADVELKTGQAEWRPATEHATENIGSTEVHILVFELKPAPVK